MTPHFFTIQKGFTLVEVLTVMLVLVAMASVTLEFSKDLAFQSRYEVTKDRYEKIRKAIVGDPHQIINGQPNIEGFVKDVGRLPFALRELITEGYCSDTDYLDDVTCSGASETWTASGYGWSGPYIATTKSFDEPTALSDGWGNAGDGNYGWEVTYYSDIACTSTTTTLSDVKCMAIQSKGKNGSIDVADSGYDKDYPGTQPSIRYEDWTVDLNSITPLVTGTGTATDICLVIVRNNYQEESLAKNIPGDNAQHPIAFVLADGHVPMGNVKGIIYSDASCTTSASAPISNASTSFTAINNNPICVDVGTSSTNFTKDNCLAKNGIWIDNATEQYCDLVSGSDCTGSTAPELGGKEFNRFQIMLSPHTTLPPVYW